MGGKLGAAQTPQDIYSSFQHAVEAGKRRSFRGGVALNPAGSTLSQHSPTGGFIQVEDYEECVDGRFVKEYLVPYFKDLYKDLALRSIHPQAIKEQRMDRVAFVQYANMPGILSERLLKIFDVQAGSGSTPAVTTTVTKPSQQNSGSTGAAAASEGIIGEASFVQNMVKIFVSDLETRMRFTFSM